MNVNISSPIIVIGMHRSGTSLVTRLLEKMGVFWGSVKDEYNESICFQLLNEQLFRQVNCKWDDTESLVTFSSNEAQNTRLSKTIHNIVDEKFFRIYCGVSISSRDKRNSNSHLIWGFKDPKNTFTLPFWLKRFPNAKVIHVIRNGIDVASSLWKRETSRLEGKNHPHYSLLCQNIEGCFDVWSCYVKRALTYDKTEMDIHELFFEDLLTNPIDSLLSLAEYLGVSETGNVHEASSIIDKSRGYGYLENTELFDFAQKKETDPLLHKLYCQRIKNSC